MIDVLLDGAAALIENDGWVQGQMYGRPVLIQDYDHEGACAMGALFVVALRSGAGDRVLDALDWAAEFTDLSLGDWNDHPDRTRDEVVAMLRLAAQTWRDSHPVGGNP